MRLSVRPGATGHMQSTQCSRVLPAALDILRPGFGPPRATTLMAVTDTPHETGWKMLSQPRNHLSVQNVSVVSPSFRFTKRDNEGRRPLRVGCEKEETMLSRCGADGHLGVPFVADAGGRVGYLPWSSCAPWYGNHHPFPFPVFCEGG